MRFRPTRKARRLSKRKALRRATTPNPGPTIRPPMPQSFLVRMDGSVILFLGEVPARSSR